jgi:hypothetical protein
MGDSLCDPKAAARLQSLAKSASPLSPKKVVSTVRPPDTRLDEKNTTYHVPLQSQEANTRDCTFVRRYHPTTANTPQSLNSKFEDLNTTISKKQYDIRDISSILYNLESF